MTLCPCGQPAEYVGILRGWGFRGERTVDGPWFGCGECARRNDDRDDFPPGIVVIRLPPIPPPSRLPAPRDRWVDAENGPAMTYADYLDHVNRGFQEGRITKAEYMRRLDATAPTLPQDEPVTGARSLGTVGGADASTRQRASAIGIGGRDAYTKPAGVYVGSGGVTWDPVRGSWFPDVVKYAQLPKAAKAMNGTKRKGKGR